MSDKTKPESASAAQSGPKRDGIDISAGPSRRVLPKEAWIPGLIEVVFKDPAQSGVHGWHFPDEKQREKFSEAWPARFSETLAKHDLRSWKPSFPLTYPWTKDSTEKAREKYRAEGRDKFVTLRFPDDAETRRIAAELREEPEIEQAVAVPRIAPPSSPLEEPFVESGEQWYIFRCKVDQAWQKKNFWGKALSGKGVVIADIDWGFYTNHQDLRSRISKTQNILLNSFDPASVDNGSRLDHGTAVLGLAGAEVNTLGIAGVAFGADLWAIQAGMDSDLDYDKFSNGIHFVREEPSSARKVIIFEVETAIGGNIEMVPSINLEIRLAIADQIVVCVPAGDRIVDAGVGDDCLDIPITGSILVGATRFDPEVNIRGISNFGSRVVVYAPGDDQRDVTCDATDDGYLAGFGGTSGAAPKVAGVVALMLEANPHLTHDQIRDILARSQTPVIELPSTQIGVLLDAELAVQAARQAWWEWLWNMIRSITSRALSFFREPPN